jgi:DNA repair exonuclease SbcCD ATPase subunit
MDNASELEQLSKRVEWLDTERRNDKTLIASLQSKLENIDNENSALRKRVAEMESEITRLNTLMARLEQFEVEIEQIRSETTQKLNSFQETVREKQMLSERNRQEIDTIKTNLTEQQKKIASMNDIQEKLDARKEEDFRLARLIDEIRAQVNEVDQFDEDYKRSLRILEENQRQDSKRLADLQGEISALRKRNDEVRGKQDLMSDQFRKLENRMGNLIKAESDRRESQTAFIEKVNLTNVERERTFKEWTERFDSIEEISTSLKQKLTEIENTNRSVKQSQTALDEVTQRFDRRVNEITEIQRLNEDRFRQEWTTFKSDDQKRWSNYTLTQEEQHREINRAAETQGERLEKVEDLIQDIQDKINQTGKEDIKRMQGVLNNMRESIETYHQIFKE